MTIREQTQQLERQTLAPWAAFSQVGSFVLSTLMNILPSWFMREESSTFRSVSFTVFICFAMEMVGNALPSNR